MWNTRCEIRRQATPETESSAPCWKLTGEGWAIDVYDRLLLWVPPDLRDVLMLVLVESGTNAIAHPSVQYTLSRINYHPALFDEAVQHRN
ncbi:unnamed protein product [Rhizoctonia solani]|uniref:Uncharacterized protein n=1 Tax=Rhizoctonia solani TaxID=456999 RepID=A0A8H2XKK9_9AGAM|nr:unnamed protein product [Rhizoctonia solani]